MSRKRGVLSISPELLADALHIEGEILEIRMNPFESGVVEILLTGDNIPDCAEGCYPLTMPLSQCMKPTWR